MRETGRTYRRRAAAGAAAAAFFVFTAFSPVFADDLQENEYIYENYEEYGDAFDEWDEEAWGSEWDDEDWDDGLDGWTEEDGDYTGDGTSEDFSGGGETDGVSPGSSDETGDGLDEVKSHLGSLPDDRESLAEAGVVTASGGGLSDSDRWRSFLESVRSGASASVDVASFNSQGEAVIDHIDFDGYRFTDVRDNTRNHHYLGSAYIVRHYSYLAGFDGSGSCALFGSGEEEGDADGWEAAALVTKRYDSLGGVYEAIENDYEGISPPTVLFDFTGAGEEGSYGYEDYEG